VSPAETGANPNHLSCESVDFYYHAFGNKTGDFGLYEQRRTTKELYMRKRLLIAMLAMLTASHIVAQSGMTDNQVADFVAEQTKQGASRQEIVTQLVQRGVTQEQIRRLQKKYEQQVAGNSLGAIDVTAGSKTMKDRMRRENGDERRELQESAQRNGSPYRVKDTNPKTQVRTHTFDEDDPTFTEVDQSIDFLMPGQTAQSSAPTKGGSGRVIFGHDIFNNKQLTFQTSMNIATPNSYVLGPGDVVNIDVWGSSQRSFSETISPDGDIVVPDIGVIQLAGLSVSQARTRIRNSVGARYQDSKIQLTLGQSRTITVNVMGEVKVPGTYTMSAFSTVYNALYMAGGPNEIGTLRSVKVYRQGRLLSNVDVYDFLLNGRLTGDVRLQDNDIITVSPYEQLVCISGKVKRPMFYEMKVGESAATLISYAGGFTGDAHTKAVRINRKAGENLAVFNVSEFDLAQFKLMDEDSVIVDANLNRYQNMVELRGAVFRPGRYQLGGDITTVKALIEAAAGLKENAIGHHAVMHRLKPDRTLQVVSVDISGILEGVVPDVPLCNEDVLYVGTMEEQQHERVVNISGEVLYPGTYQYAEDETIEDLIIQAGGLTEAASLSKIDVARRVSDPDATKSTNQISQNFSFQIDRDFRLNATNDFYLQPYDEVYVRRNPSYSELQNVFIEGEIEFQGTYALSDKEERLSQVIAKAGGLSPHAYAEGAKLLRRMTSEERDQMALIIRTAQRNTGKDSIDVGKLLAETNYRVAIELDEALKHPGSEADPILRAGDHIVIPRFSNTVSINGEVLYPNTVQFKKSLKARDYIQQAGGYTNAAKKSKTIIIYSNGYVAKADSRHHPAPGCQIVVPSKRAGRPFSLSEILSVGTSTASLATMIVTLSNLINK